MVRLAGKRAHHAGNAGMRPHERKDSRVTATTYEERAELRAMRRRAREDCRRTRAAARAGAVICATAYGAILATVFMWLLGI